MLVFVITIVIHLFTKFGIIHSLVSVKEHKSVFHLILMAVIIAPLAEEITFRSWLTYNRYLVSLFLSVLCIYWVLPLVLNFKIFQNVTNIAITISIGLSVYIVSCFLLKNTSRNFIKKWNKNTRFLFLLSSFIFGYIHIFNYNITTNLLLFSPLIVLPHIIGGLIIGYIRLNMGFIWGVFYHVLSNLISVSIFILMS